MSIPPIIVSSARKSWKWQWNQLMNGLAPADSNGNYCRKPSQALNAKVPGGTDLLSRSSQNLPVLIIGRSCPWAHRTWLLYELKDLRKSLNLLIAYPEYTEGLWKISPAWMDCQSLLGIYKLCDAPPIHRATVPALIDPKPANQKHPKLLGNESAQLVETMNNWPGAKNTFDFYPMELQNEIDQLQSLIQESINNGVYKCGFARNQRAYENASEHLFNALHRLNIRLASKGPWLCGERLTLADIRLFPTMIRWESIYSPLFKCSEKPLTSFPKLLDWRKNFYNLANVSKTCNTVSWREDYYGALFPLNPNNIIPKGASIEEIISIT